MALIQSIKNYLKNDETKFNEFKNHSGQFRQVTNLNSVNISLIIIIIIIIIY